MRKLETIQTKEKLNEVFAVDEVGPGGANHEYNIVLNDAYDKDYASDVIVIQFQNGPYSSEYNKKALIGVEIALNALNQRVEDRIARNVLGKNEK